MRAALIYVSEYTEMKRMMTEGQYNNDDLLVRLRAVFGNIDQVRHHTDLALQQDNIHRRKRNMMFLILPTRFPRPESMSQGDIAVWMNWIREETDEIMKQLEEEKDSRSDPDDPFNGTANGVFQPLQDPLSLLPPVQMPKRQENIIKGSEHFQNSRENVRKENIASKEERRNETDTFAQGEPREFREHSRESLDPMASICNLHMQQRQNRRSTQELNQTTPSAPQTTRIQVKANLITFSPVVEQQVPTVQGATGIQEQAKRQRSPRKKKKSEWTLNQRQFDHSKTQEISHILPGEQLNVFNGEESVSYLQLPVKKKEENRFCTRCGKMGHGRCYCQVNTWCKFCITDTHATQACRKYEKFVKNNPIASSRRNTPVQIQGQRVAVNPQERPQQPLFPHPPVQCYNPTVIPQMEMHNLVLQVEERESREHSLKSPQNQMKEVRTLMSKQFPHQMSCQDICMDPRYQKPPQYAEINYHRPPPQTPVEVNEIGPTIQQGIIQRPVQRHTQAAGGPRRPTVPVNVQQTMSVPSLQINENAGACEQQESDPDQNGYIFNCVHENRPFTVNDVGRPVFVNHYYAGEAIVPITSKKLIKLDECDVSTEISLKIAQPQSMDRKSREHSQNSQIIQHRSETEREQVQRHGNAAVHRDLREYSRNLLRMTSVSRNTEAIQKTSNLNRGIHSEFIERSQKSLGALNIGKSRVQAADQMSTRHIPLTGYENFHQELQTYPVSRDPMTVQPTGVGNVSNSAILDLPNVNTNLPPLLLPNPSSQIMLSSAAS